MSATKRPLNLDDEPAPKRYQEAQIVPASAAVAEDGSAEFKDEQSELARIKLLMPNLVLVKLAPVKRSLSMITNFSPKLLAYQAKTVPMMATRLNELLSLACATMEFSADMTDFVTSLVTMNVDQLNLLRITLNDLGSQTRHVSVAQILDMELADDDEDNELRIRARALLGRNRVDLAEPETPNIVNMNDIIREINAPMSAEYQEVYEDLPEELRKRITQILLIMRKFYEALDPFYNMKARVAHVKNEVPTLDGSFDRPVLFRVRRHRVQQYTFHELCDPELQDQIRANVAKMTRNECTASRIVFSMPKEGLTSYFPKDTYSIVKDFSMTFENGLWTFRLFRYKNNYLFSSE